MLGFTPDELVWAIQREREEEARHVNPHTSRKPDTERTPLDRENRNPLGTWVAPNLRAGYR